MKINILRSFAQKLGRGLRLAVPAAAILAGGMAFVGEAQATVILSEDFEDDGDDSWGGGAETFGVYASSQNYSASDHGQIPGGGARYGHLISGTGSSINGGPLPSAPINLPEGSVITFEGWISSWTGDANYTEFNADFFDGPDGTGNNLGNVILAEGNSTEGVVAVINGGTFESGAANWNEDNWSLYQTSNAIPAGAQSVVINYAGRVGNQNDAYADNVVISVVPEPTSLALAGLGLAGLGLVARRRK